MIPKNLTTNCKLLWDTAHSAKSVYYTGKCLSRGVLNVSKGLLTQFFSWKWSFLEGILVVQELVSSSFKNSLVIPHIEFDLSDRLWEQWHSALLFFGCKYYHPLTKKFSVATLTWQKSSRVGEKKTNSIQSVLLSDEGNDLFWVNCNTSQILYK